MLCHPTVAVSGVDARKKMRRKQIFVLSVVVVFSALILFGINFPSTFLSAISFLVGFLVKPNWCEVFALFLFQRNSHLLKASTVGISSISFISVSFLALSLFLPISLSPSLGLSHPLSLIENTHLYETQ